MAASADALDTSRSLCYSRRPRARSSSLHYGRLLYCRPHLSPRRLYLSRKHTRLDHSCSRELVICYTYTFISRHHLFWSTTKGNMSSSRDARVEDTYELQNDQRLEELHSKLRTLRGVR